MAICGVPIASTGKVAAIINAGILLAFARSVWVREISRVAAESAFARTSAKTNLSGLTIKRRREALRAERLLRR